MEEHSPYLTVAQAADLLCISRKTVYDMVKRGDVDHIRVGEVKGIRVTRASIDRLVKAGELMADITEAISNVAERQRAYTAAVNERVAAEERESIAWLELSSARFVVRMLTADIGAEL